MRIHIITLPGKILHGSYVISQLAKCWVKMGFEVTSGPTAVLDAEIGVLHIDATAVPAGCIPGNPRGRPLINEKILDISKNRISRHILSKNSDYDGPVIVKTDGNCYGTQELRRLPLFSIRNLRRKITHSLPGISWKITRELPHKNYPILNNLDEVPEWVWKRRDLVVERFQPEIENGHYVLRVWLFLGDKDYNIKMYSREPIVKAGNIIGREIVESVPDALRKIRAELGIDFGKFDYVLVDGEAVLFDVNKTPTTTAKEQPSENLMRVATGILHYCEPGQDPSRKIPPANPESA